MAKSNKKTESEKCEDKKCPFHGNLSIRGRTFTGVIIAKDTHKTATVEWSYKFLIPKYERKEIRRSKIRVHNPPCIDANVGDIVKISETRPLSKTKNFVIIENLGKEKGFEEKMEAEEESKMIIDKKERKNISIEDSEISKKKNKERTKEEKE